MGMEMYIIFFKKEGLTLMNKRWYISYNFNPHNINSIIQLCQILQQNGCELLLGNNLCSNSVMTAEQYEKINSAIERYEANSQGISFEVKSAIQKGIFAITGCKTDCVEDFLNHRMMGYDKNIQLRIKFLIAYLLEMPNMSGRIRFFSVPDTRFSTSENICTEFDPYNMFMWYSVERNELQQLTEFGPTPILMITEDSTNYQNYHYLIECVEYNNYSLVMHGDKNSMEYFIRNELGNIFSDEYQFVAYHNGSRKYM